MRVEDPIDSALTVALIIISVAALVASLTYSFGGF